MLLPVFAELRSSLDEASTLRILNCDYDLVELLLPVGIDIVFEYSAAPTAPSAVKVLDEAVVPVASPAFVKRFEQVLAKHPRYWSDVPRLDVAERGQPWVSWTSWFRANGCDVPNARVVPFENYEYLLESAARGEGLAIGWNGYVDTYLETRRLVRVRDNWLRSLVGLYALLTQAGYSNRNATSCLKALAAVGERLASTGPVSPQRQPGPKSTFKQV